MDVAKIFVSDWPGRRQLKSYSQVKQSHDQHVYYLKSSYFAHWWHRPRHRLNWSQIQLEHSVPVLKAVYALWKHTQCWHSFINNDKSWTSKVFIFSITRGWTQAKHCCSCSCGALQFVNCTPCRGLSILLPHTLKAPQRLHLYLAIHLQPYMYEWS